ncbi:MAG: ABC transporter ATP-binding protein [Methylophilaceae bacterium]
MNTKNAKDNRPSTSATKSYIGQEDYVQIIDVEKKFGDVVAVHNLCLSIRKNEVFALLGSSGCGKSTLLRMMAGLETPTSGRILIDGEDLSKLPPFRRPVNMMFQSYALFPHMTVENNVAYGLKQEGIAKPEIKERVEAVLELVQMQNYKLRKPHQLSGGQQQRVALARSLVKRPKLLLLDEPMSALDKKIRQQTQFELGNILFKVGVTCVMVTHDQEEAMTMADRIAVMTEGEIVQIGTPNEVYEAPSSRFTAEFIGSTNMFEGKLTAENGQLLACPDLEVPMQLRQHVDASVGKLMTVSVRPEQISISHRRPTSKHNFVSGVVDQFAYMGSYTLFYVRLASGKVVVSNVSRLVAQHMEKVPNYDESVYLSWEPASCVVLD